MTLSRRSALLLPWGLSQARATAPPIAIGGTGGALGTLRALGHGFHRLSGHTLQIVPSLGTQGGIRAVADGKIDIAVVGRAPNPAEQARGVQVMHELRTPFGFVEGAMPIARVEAEHPDVRLFGAGVDDGLDARRFIVPGLGDFGDRLNGF